MSFVLVNQHVIVQFYFMHKSLELPKLQSPVATDIQIAVHAG